MKKIDIYILKKVLKTFIFVVLGLILVICAIDFTEKNDRFIEHSLKAGEIMRYYSTVIPYYIGFITPITVFIAVVFVTANLSARTEIIAILTSGISFYRMLFPYILSAACIGIISFFFNGYIVPDGNKFRIDFETKYIKRPSYYTDRNIHLKIDTEDYLYMQNYDTYAKTGYNVTLEHIQNYKMLSKLKGSRIQWDTAIDKWKLYDWENRVLDTFGEQISRGIVLDTFLHVTDADFESNQGMHETMTNPELSRHIELLHKRASDDVHSFIIEKYIRIMSPFAILILTLLGVLISSQKSRRGTGFLIALGFTLAFIYIIFFTLARAIAQNGAWNPLLAVWVPNITFLSICIIVFLLIKK